MLRDVPDCSRGKFGSVAYLGVAGAARAIAHEGDDFTIGVNAPPVIEYVIDSQRTILHGAQHRNLPV
ncbi:MAG: hypothetical protein DMF60_15225 [Acidobacteria bacterium]|nr:MAG: hypothetical protein DMF60_15225 [Acidobacteriota bacterium]